MWNRSFGSFSGNADFDVTLRPPLHLAWEHPLGVLREGDGIIVGGDGRVFVTVRKSEVDCVDLRSGKVVKEIRRARWEDGDIVFYALGRYWARRPTGVFVVDAATGSGELQKDGVFAGSSPTSRFHPIGVYIDGGGTYFCQWDGAVKLNKDWSFEPWPDEFMGEFTQAGRVLGERVPASRIFEERRFACLDLATRTVVWTLDEPRVIAPMKQFWTMSDEIAVAYQEPGREEKYDVYRLKDGKLLWSLKVRKSGGNEYPLRPVVISEGVLFHADREDAVGHVHALDAKTGKPLWSFKDRDFSTPGESFISNIIGTKGLIWVALYGKKQCRLTAIDKAKGKRVWSMDTKTLGWLRFIDDAIVCIQGRKLVCFRSEAAG